MTTHGPIDKAAGLQQPAITSLLYSGTPMALNQRQIITLAYYDNWTNPQRRTAVQALKGQNTGTLTALRDRGLIESCDIPPYTALTDLGRQVLAEVLETK
jgi:hypothetical protein